MYKSSDLSVNCSGKLLSVPEENRRLKAQEISEEGFGKKFSKKQGGLWGGEYDLISSLCGIDRQNFIPVTENEKASFLCFLCG